MAKRDTYINFILGELRGGEVSFEVILSKLSMTKHDLSRNQFSTYWKQAQELYSVEQREIEEKKRALHKEEQLKAFESKIKSKIQRESELEQSKQAALNMLSSLKTEDYYFVKNEPPVKYERNLTASEISTLQRSIVSIDAELSKMRGDYAATKSDHTTDGKPIGVVIISDD